MKIRKNVNIKLVILTSLSLFLLASIGGVSFALAETFKEHNESGNVQIGVSNAKDEEVKINSLTGEPFKVVSQGFVSVNNDVVSYSKTSYKFVFKMDVTTSLTIKTNSRITFTQINTSTDSIELLKYNPSLHCNDLELNTYEYTSNKVVFNTDTEFLNLNNEGEENKIIDFSINFNIDESDPNNAYLTQNFELEVFDKLLNNPPAFKLLLEVF